MEKRCSTRSCGVHPQRLPLKANAGVASEANEVGESGEMNKRILPGDQRGVLPVEAQAGRLQAHDSEVHAVSRGRETSGKIELNIRRSSCACDVRTKKFESDLRLAQGRAQVACGVPGGDRFGVIGKSRLSDPPTLRNAFIRTMPCSRARYLEAVSTFV